MFKMNISLVLEQWLFLLKSLWEINLFC